MAERLELDVFKVPSNPTYSIDSTEDFFKKSYTQMLNMFEHNDPGNFPGPYSTLPIQFTFFQYFNKAASEQCQGPGCSQGKKHALLFPHLLSLSSPHRRQSVLSGMI